MGSPDENCGGSHPIFSSLRTCPAARNPLALEGPMRPSLDMMPPITWPWWRWRSRPWTHSPLGSSTVLQRLDVLQMGTTMPNLEWEYEWELWIITLRTISFGWLLIKGLFVLRRTCFFCNPVVYYRWSIFSCSYILFAGLLAVRREFNGLVQYGIHMAKSPLKILNNVDTSWESCQAWWGFVGL